MGTLWHDLRYGGRMLVRNPGLAVLATLILAIGIGANTAIFSVLNAFILRPLPYDKAEELVSVYENEPNQHIERFGAAGPKYLDWRKENTVFQEMGATAVCTQGLTGSGEPVPVVTCQVTPSYLRTFRLRPFLGRLFEEDEDQAGKNQLIILTHSLWTNRFGGRRDVLGRTVRLDGKPHTVIGVLAPGGLRCLDGDAIAFVPLAAEKVRDGPGVHYYQVIARLKPGVSVEQSQAAMTVLADALRKKEPRYGDWGVKLVSLRKDLLGDWPDWQTIVLLQGAVLAVLLIACANTANLLLSRAAGRGKEIAVRMAIGGGRWRVVRQLLCESVLLAALGGGVGLVLAGGGIEWAGRWLRSQNIQLWTAVRMDGAVAGFCLGLSLLTGVVFGLAPALQMTRAEVQTPLQGTGRTATGGVAHRRTLDALAVAEIALALILLICAGLFTRNLLGLRGRDPGFDPTRVLTMQVFLTEAAYPGDPQRNQFVEAALDRLQALPGVRSVGVTDVLPMDGASGWDFWVQDRPRGAPNSWGGTQLRRISPDYFRTVGVPLLRGRPFGPADRSGAASVAIVNETLARRFFPGEDPLGRQVGTGDGIANPHQIVGIAKDERVFGLTNQPEPVVYVPTAQGWFKGSSTSYALSLAIRTDLDARAVAQVAQRELRRVDPELVYANVRPMRQLVDGSLLSQRLGSFLLGSFSFVALILAALGIYGVMANAVSQRTNEIGIRMALGARVGDVLRLVLARGLVLTGLGLSLGLAGSLAVTRLLRSFLQDISPTDPCTFAVLPCVLGALSLLACYLPARRAARVDPMVALRYE
jgi:putative ABC transport system permease protein